MADLISTGEHIYRTGLRPDGTALIAYVQNDVPLPPGAGACASCHRRSGIGIAEGGTPRSLNLTAAALFSPRDTAAIPAGVRPRELDLGDHRRYRRGWQRTRRLDAAVSSDECGYRGPGGLPENARRGSESGSYGHAPGDRDDYFRGHPPRHSRSDRRCARAICQYEKRRYAARS